MKRYNVIINLIRWHRCDNRHLPKFFVKITSLSNIETAIPNES